MDFLSLISQNILSPAILFFALGLIAGLLKSDLEVPDSISRYLSLYWSAPREVVHVLG